MILSKKSKISLLIIAYLLAMTTAIVLKVDHFPITWGPMFSTVPNAKKSYTIATVDRAQVEKGILVTFSDRSQRWINHKDLNIPFNLTSIGDSYIGIYRYLTVVCDVDRDDQGINAFTLQRNRKKRARFVVNKIMRMFGHTLNQNTNEKKRIVDLTVWRRLTSYNDIDKNLQISTTLNLEPVSCKKLAASANNWQ